MRVLLLVLTFLLSLPASAQTQPAGRVALVIAISEYTGPARLTNPLNDARLVHAALNDTGFDTGEILVDPTKAQLEAELRAFARRAHNADAAVVYYSGHAVQAFEETWLVPVNARLELQDDILTEGVQLSTVVTVTRRATLSIVFLDACRNNPWEANRGGDGLPLTPAPEGSVIAYAAAEGRPAPDDGAYARALAQRMREEGIELRQLLDRVAGDVGSERNLTAALYPVASIQLRGETHFYFRPPETQIVCPTASERPQGNERRVALVVGMFTYDNAPPLYNASSDALLLHRALCDTGFESVAVFNQSKRELERTLIDFSRRAAASDVALLYYSGHGVQTGEDNWLIAADALLSSAYEVPFESVRLYDVVNFMGQARLRIAFIDACRSNPFSLRWQQYRQVGEGLAAIEGVPAGTVVAYSCGVGTVIPDDGRYARALATRIQERGLELSQLLERVARDVSADHPSYYTQNRNEEFYFRPPD